MLPVASTTTGPGSIDACAQTQVLHLAAFLALAFLQAPAGCERRPDARSASFSSARTLAEDGHHTSLAL